MGKNKILAAFSSNTTKSVTLQPFRENSFSVQISLFSEWFAALTLSFVAALPECKYNLESFLYLIECVRWLKSCFKTSITYCKCVKLFVYIYLKQMYFFCIYLFILSVYISHRWLRQTSGFNFCWKIAFYIFRFSYPVKILQTSCDRDQREILIRRNLLSLAAL